MPEVQVDAPGGPGGRTLRPVRESAHDDAALRELLQHARGMVVELEVGGIDDHLHVVLLPELAQLQGREAHIGGATTGEQVHVADPARGERVEDVVGSVGRLQRRGVLREDACDVEGDVARPEHGHGLRLQAPTLRDVGVRVVPGHELRGAERSGKLRSRHVERHVAVGSGRDDDAVVRPAELVDRHIDTDLDVAAQPDAGLEEHVVQRVDDLADARVVGGDAVADEPVRCGELLVQVDGRLRHLRPEQVGGVDARGARADDGDARGHSCTSCGGSAAMSGWS